MGRRDGRRRVAGTRRPGPRPVRPDVGGDDGVVEDRFALAGLAAEADLFRLLQRDGPDFPELTALVHEQLVQRGYDFAIAVFTRLLQARGLPVGDAPALAAIALGSLVHFREDEALYGRTPAGATEERFLATWVDTWLRVLASRAAEAKRRAVT